LNLFSEFCQEFQISTGCFECQKKYCQGCFEVLHSPKMLKNHEPTPLSKMETIEFCSKHSKKIAEFFCVDDEICICSTCAFLEHKEHQCVDIQQGMENLKSLMESLDFTDQLKFIQESIKKIDKKMSELEISKVALKESFGKLEKFKENLKSKKSLSLILEFKKSMFSDSFIQNSIGDAYYYGNGVDQDFKKAVEFYNLSAEQGYFEAQYNLGICYENGKGVDENIEKAFEFYNLSAEQGNIDGFFKIGRLYYFQKDFKNAFKFFTISADKGDAPSQWYLALFYENGYGVEQNLKKAFELYTLSAEQEDSDAQYSLATFYEEGKGVDINMEKAVELYMLSAQQGDESSIDRLKNLK
jgi:hypothetical protein